MTATDPPPAQLEELPLFQGLPAAELARLQAAVRRTTFPANTRLISAEQPGEAVYVLVQGTVKIQLEREDGSEVTLAILGPGDTIGEMSLIDRADRSANVITIEDSTFLWIDRASFLDCLRSSTQLTYNLVRQLSGRLRVANQKIQALSTMDVAGRVARQLLSFADQYGQQTEDGWLIPLPLTQSDIAEMVGATRERVNHFIATWKQRGIISVDSQLRITVHDREALADRCR